MELLHQRDSAIPFRTACEALALNRTTAYRRLRPPRQRGARVRPSSPRRLSELERDAILEVLHSERFADQPPAEIYAALLEEGTYLASPRSMYRILASRSESKERRAQRAPRSAPTPSLIATAPNDVWTWDMTKLPTFEAGRFLSLYVVLDLWSRYVVAWMIAERENSALAKQLFAEAILHRAETAHRSPGSRSSDDEPRLRRPARGARCRAQLLRDHASRTTIRSPKRSSRRSSTGPTTPVSFTARTMRALGVGLLPLVQHGAPPPRSRALHARDAVLQSRRRRRCTAAAGARRRVRPSSRAVRSRPAGSLRGRARASPSIRSFPTRLASLQPICCVLKIPPLCSRARRVAPLRRSSSFQALRRSCGRALLHRFPELAVAKSLTRSEGAVIHP
jgi:hypothetical protein